jgi:hypothetical protein
MNYTAQVIYTDFTEVFDVTLKNSHLDLCLKEIRPKPLSKTDLLTLDLSTNIKEGYSKFPYESGDLVIIQIADCFVVANHGLSEINWFKFTVNDVISFLFEKNLTHQILPYINEDNHIFLNSLLNDLIRNDYSYSEINKKIKFAKVALLLSFLDANLNYPYKRVVLDETVLGDVEVDQIGIAFRFSNQKFLKLSKITNVLKIASLLEKEKLIDPGLRFPENAYFINNPLNGDKIKLVFGESGIKFDYQVLPSKNYIFDLGEKEYIMNVGNIYRETVSGKVVVYNGDERDLMIGK